jgi:hypothetical protein
MVPFCHDGCKMFLINPKNSANSPFSLILQITVHSHLNVTLFTLVFQDFVSCVVSLQSSVFTLQLVLGKIKVVFPLAVLVSFYLVQDVEV